MDLTTSGNTATVIAIIPARGGSKGVPRKNVRPLLGKPLIGYTIEAAQRCRTELDLVVSTEDAEIAEVARAFGAEVHERPANLAEDETPMVPVAEDVLAAKRQAGCEYEHLVLLQCTSPLRLPEDIDEAVAILRGGTHDAVIAVSDVDEMQPARMYEIRDDRLSPLTREYDGINRQDLPKIYYRNGVIYAVRVDEFMRSRSFFL